MRRPIEVLALTSVLILVTCQVWAQDQGDERSATTTFLGDTGLWFVPTGEILGHKKWSISGYRSNWDVAQGFTDISHFIFTGAFGIRDRVEIFGNWRLDTRIDRDIRPLFRFGDPLYGGVDNEYPFVREGWTGDNLGDVFLGLKVNALSETREQPLAFGVRGLVKLPTGDEEKGTGTGKVDFGVDAIASKELAQVTEITGSVGYLNRGDPDEFELSDSLRWGVGAAFPTRSPLKFTTELTGEANFESNVLTKGTFTAVDGSIAPLSSKLRDPLTFAVGATWQTRRGIFAGGGVNWSSKAEDREDAGVTDDDDNFGTRFGWQFRIGYHPPTVLALPVPPPPPPPPPPVAAAPPHMLSVKAQCDPCVVEIGQTSTVTAFPQSSIGCVVTYQWTAPSGTLAAPTQQKTIWTAPQQVGTVPVTVTVTCPTDKLTASDTVQIQVIQPPVKKFIFEDVYFDFDRFSLTDAALRVLAEAANTLRQNPQLRVRIEGNTCNIGTAEYNLALGERRATSVRDYFTSNGIAAGRLTTISYGEEQPKFDNAREETRRLNRRAALTVQLVAP